MKKTNVNQLLWIQPLKNIMKINAFHIIGNLGAFGTPMGPRGYYFGEMKKKLRNY